jgi:hypothetical protein
MNDFLQDLIYGIIGLTCLGGGVALGCFILFWDVSPRWAITQRVLRWTLAVALFLLVAYAFGHALRFGSVGS